MDAHSQVVGRVSERAELEHWIRAATTPQRVVWRTRIVLLAMDGLSSVEIAAQVGVSHPTVRLWLRRFANDGAAALLHDAPGRGRHAVIDLETLMSQLQSAQLIDQNGEPTSVREAAKHVGVSASTIRRVLHKRTAAS